MAELHVLASTPAGNSQPFCLFPSAAKRHQAAHPSSGRSQPQPPAATGAAMGAFMQDVEDDDNVGAQAAAAGPAGPSTGQAVERAAPMDVDSAQIKGLDGPSQQLGSAKGQGRRRALRAKPDADDVD